MNSKSIAALGALGLALALSAPARAAEYCAIPYLYATNIRPSCDQLGAHGMAALYESSRFIHQLRVPPHPAPAVGHVRERTPVPVAPKT